MALFRATGVGCSDTVILGKNKFDLATWNNDYFTRLSSRVSYAQSKGVYVQVMLFEGTTVCKNGAPSYCNCSMFTYSPYDSGNSIQSGMLTSCGDLFTLNNATVTSYYDAYIEKVIDTLNSYDNVLWEVCNECGLPGVLSAARSTWEDHVLDKVKAYEATKPKQHPVGMTAYWGNGNPDPPAQAWDNYFWPSDPDFKLMLWCSGCSGVAEKRRSEPEHQTPVDFGKFLLCFRVASLVSSRSWLSSLSPRLCFIAIAC